MQIETYFQQLQNLLDACPTVRSQSMTYDKRGTHEGFVRGEVYFVDESVLHLREFVDVETTIERLLYVYQYMDPTKTLVFRYDNTGHHKQLNLPTYPHHKHAGSDANGPVSIVFMSLGIPTVNQEAIAQILGNMPFVTVDDLCTRLLVGPNHLPQVFRIKLAGELGGVHEVAEHHRELAAFGFRRMELRWLGNRWRIRLRG